MKQLTILTLLAVAALPGSSRAHFTATEGTWFRQDWRATDAGPVPPIGQLREPPASRCVPDGRCPQNPYKLGCLNALAELGRPISDSQVAICEYFSSEYAVEALRAWTRHGWMATHRALKTIAGMHSPYAVACMGQFPRYSYPGASEEVVEACANFASPFAVQALELVTSRKWTINDAAMHTISQYSCRASVECMVTFLQQGHNGLSNALLESCGR